MRTNKWIRKNSHLEVYVSADRKKAIKSVKYNEEYLKIVPYLPIVYHYFGKLFPDK